METYIKITYLNDFIFCPISIYFHQLYDNVKQELYYDTIQFEGKASHSSIDSKTYSDKKDILQGINVYCEKYELCGKIDIFDKSLKLLTERKKNIKKIYDGYIFQLYAQYFCLIEMGYDVQNIRLYSMDDNKRYEIKLPHEDIEMSTKFENLLHEIKNFDFEKYLPDNILKCKNCIYSNSCYMSLND